MNEANAEISEFEKPEKPKVHVNIPKPVGWRILVMPLIAEDISSGGIAFPEQATNANKHLNTVGKVMAMGELCYTHEKYLKEDGEYDRFCEVGDNVQYPINSGHKFTVYAPDGTLVEFLILNDDQIISSVGDPTVIRAWV